jgi:hypothetical protein
MLQIYSWRLRLAKALTELEQHIKSYGYPKKRKMFVSKQVSLRGFSAREHV